MPARGKVPGERARATPGSRCPPTGPAQFPLLGLSLRVRYRDLEPIQATLAEVYFDTPQARPQ